MNPSDCPIREGFLSKVGQAFISRTRRRWFKLYGGPTPSLVYHTEANGDTIGTLPLPNAKAIVKGTGFTISGPFLHRTVELRALTIDDSASWAAEINQVIQQAEQLSTVGTCSLYPGDVGPTEQGRTGPPSRPLPVQIPPACAASFGHLLRPPADLAVLPPLNITAISVFFFGHFLRVRHSATAAPTTHAARSRTPSPSPSVPGTANGSSFAGSIAPSTHPTWIPPSVPHSFSPGGGRALSPSTAASSSTPSLNATPREALTPSSVATQTPFPSYSHFLAKGPDMLSGSAQSLPPRLAPPGARLEQPPLPGPATPLRAQSVAVAVATKHIVALLTPYALYLCTPTGATRRAITACLISRLYLQLSPLALAVCVDDDGCDVLLLGPDAVPLAAAIVSVNWHVYGRTVPVVRLPEIPPLLLSLSAPKHAVKRFLPDMATVALMWNPSDGP